MLHPLQFNIPELNPNDKISIKRAFFSQHAEPQFVKSGHCHFLGITNYVDIAEYDCGFMGCNHILHQANKMDKLTALSKSGLHQIGSCYDLRENSPVKSYFADLDELRQQFFDIDKEDYTEPHSIHFDVLLEEDVVGRLHIGEGAAFATMIETHWQTQTPFSGWKLIGETRFTAASKRKFENHLHVLTKLVISRLVRCDTCRKLKLPGHTNNGTCHSCEEASGCVF